MALANENVKTMSKLMSRRAVSSGLDYMLEHVDTSVSEKLFKLYRSHDKLLALFAQEMNNIRAEIKENIVDYMNGYELNGHLKLLDQSLVDELLPSISDKEAPEFTNFEMPLLDLSNIRKDKTPVESSRSVSSNAASTSKEPPVDDQSRFESPDFVEVSDSSAENTSLINKIVENILSLQTISSAKSSSLPKESHQKTHIISTPLLANTVIECGKHDESECDKLSKSIIPEEELSNGTVSYYSAISSNNSNISVGECQITNHKNIVSFLPDGSIDVLKTPRVVDHELEQEMQYSSHRLSPDDADDISPMSGTPRVVEFDWVQNPSIPYVDITSSFNSENIEIVSARSKENGSSL